MRERERVWVSEAVSVREISDRSRQTGWVLFVLVCVCVMFKNVRHRCGGIIDLDLSTLDDGLLSDPDQPYLIPYPQYYYEEVLLFFVHFVLRGIEPWQEGASRSATSTDLLVLRVTPHPPLNICMYYLYAHGEKIILSSQLPREQ